MTLADDIGPYEGLIHATAARYAPILVDEDYDDLVQILALKVWQARRAFDQSRTKLGEESYVFSCVTNRVKDLLKAQSRLNKNRGGGPTFIEDVDPERRFQFEGKYLQLSEEDAFADVEDELPALPSTLTHVERTVTILLVLDFKKSEIVRMTGYSRSRVVKAEASVREKMDDWRPTGVGRRNGDRPRPAAAVAA
jgi:RNA polymerase sigma factor (sigma-70 family)